MTEEQVTLKIIDGLKKSGWKIVCFDYPQSGTGRLCKPRNSSSRAEGFVPDIVAVKNGTALFFENKDRFVQGDFDKINRIKSQHEFDDSIKELLEGHGCDVILFGIGLPTGQVFEEKAIVQKGLVDFICMVDDVGTIRMIHGAEKMRLR